MEQWLIVELMHQPYAINVQFIKELTPAAGQQISALPGTPAYVVGVMNLRSRVLPVIDLRTLLGMPSLVSESLEVVQLLHDREQDHVDWINALETCARDGTEFKLVTDPHKCKFGRWYDGLLADPEQREHLTSGSIALDGMLDQFDAPHRRIHGIAQHVAVALGEGRLQEAQAIIDMTRGTELAKLRELFAGFGRLFAEVRSSMVVVIEQGSGLVGVQVDALDSVVRIPQARIQPLADTLRTGRLVTGTAQTEGVDLLLLIDDRALVRMLAGIATRGSSRASPVALQSC
jgi:purine-binding chemotaxis protein CheW